MGVHLNHANILHYTTRPMLDVDTMNDALLEAAQIVPFHLPGIATRLHLKGKLMIAATTACYHGNGAYKPLP